MQIYLQHSWLHSYLTLCVSSLAILQSLQYRSMLGTEKKNQQNLGALWKPPLVKEGSASSWLLQHWWGHRMHPSSSQGDSYIVIFWPRASHKLIHTYSCAGHIWQPGRASGPSINYCCKPAILRLIPICNKLNSSVQLSTGFSDFQALDFLISSWYVHMYRIFQSGKSVQLFWSV